MAPNIFPGGPRRIFQFEETPSKKTILQMKAKHIQLQKELNALEKAEKVEVRSQQAKELDFRVKYDKYLTRGNFESSLITKDGFKKTAKTFLQGLHSAEHYPLHKLIYSNGEVDVEKVFCLHLLSVQRIRLSQVENNSLSLFAKRSKPNMLHTSALPFYIVEIHHQVKIEPNNKEGQDIIILVNTNLEKLIVAILEVLAIVSPKKLQKIKEISLSKKMIREIMCKTKIYNLLAQIKECPVLFKMANYRLEAAQFHEEPSFSNDLSVCCIKLKDRSKKFEMIQSEIRKAVAIFTEEEKTSCESWSMCHRKYCSCKKSSSKTSLISGNSIALLTEDGTEFAVVTGTGCRMPTGTSIFCPNTAAVIKSSPRQQKTIGEANSRLSLIPRSQSFVKNDNKKLLNSLLHKISNAQRILIGKKLAEFKTYSRDKKIKKQRTPMSKIMEQVFSKESLISFASTAEHDELKMLFQPCCRGGLGIGSIILEPDKIKDINTLKNSLKILHSTWDLETESVPEIMKQEESIMKTAFIKQDIFTSETRTKMKQFLLSKNL